MMFPRCMMSDSTRTNASRSSPVRPSTCIARLQRCHSSCIRNRTASLCSMQHTPAAQHAARRLLVQSNWPNPSGRSPPRGKARLEAAPGSAEQCGASKAAWLRSMCGPRVGERPRSGPHRRSSRRSSSCPSGCNRPRRPMNLPYESSVSSRKFRARSRKSHPFGDVAWFACKRVDCAAAAWPSAHCGNQCNAAWRLGGGLCGDWRL